MKINPLVASIVVGIGALACLGAVIWQVTHDHDVDPLLAGLTGTLFAAMLPSPLPQAVQIRQPVDEPVPVENQGGYGLVELCIAVLVIVVLILVIAQLV